ncbi:AMP-binding protein [Xanthobacter pseudotagetidis]|uniref:AMP-binding protein n=1 Tax=Xanthobacter pseudotagetidis TaxID=3119911 RepID=UPI00372BDCC6
MAPESRPQPLSADRAAAAAAGGGGIARHADRNSLSPRAIADRQMNFDTLLRRHEAERPHAVGLIDGDQPVRYAELQSEVHRVAGLLHAQGARPGDRLALWLPNCAAWLVTFMACARLGVTVVAMNTRFRSHEVGDLISRSQAKWLVMWPAFKGLPFQQILSDVAPDRLQSLRGVMIVGAWEGKPAVDGVATFAFTRAGDASALDGVPQAAGDSYALVYTTSGTTTQPKLVVHDQETLIRHGEAVARHFGIGEGDAVLLGAPFCGAFGFSSALGALAAGVPMVTSPVIDPDECARQIVRHEITHTFANNELLDRILDAADAAGLPLASLRIAGFASFAPSLEGLPERSEKAGITLVGLYGSSELQALVAGQPAAASLEQRQQPGGTLVADDARVRARDVASGEVLPHGEVGELEIKSPSLMRGYLDNPEATAQAVDDGGYFRTGDLGHTVSEREFVFHARRGDFLRLSGFLVNPREIEAFIEALEGVASCQVVGAVKDGKSVPVAFVIPELGEALREEEIIGSCSAQLARFKVPVRVGVVDAFPVVESANSNKIQRSRLGELAQALLGGTP